MFILTDNCYISKSQTFMRPIIKAYNIEESIKSYNLDLTKIEDFGINPNSTCLYKAIECPSEDEYLEDDGYSSVMDNDIILYYKQLGRVSIKYGFIPVNIIKDSSTRIFYYNKNGKTSELRKDKLSVMFRSAYITCKDALIAARGCTAVVGSVGVLAFIYIEDFYANNTKFVCGTIVLKEGNMFSDFIVDISSGFKIWCCDANTKSAYLVQDDSNTVFDLLIKLGTLIDHDVYELKLDRCKESKTPSDALATLPTLVQQYKGAVTGDPSIHYLYSFKDESILVRRVWYLEYYSEIEQKFYLKNRPVPYLELSADLLDHCGFTSEKAAHAASVVYNKECHTEYLTVRSALLYKSKSSDNWNFVG